MPSLSRQVISGMGVILSELLNKFDKCQEKISDPCVCYCSDPFQNRCFSEPVDEP